MSSGGELPIYQMLGPDRLSAVVNSFYRRVPDDPILGPMYPEDDMAGAEERLRDFLVYRLGGPPDYLQKRGHPRLRMRHAPYALDRAARDRWVGLMTEAMIEQEVPEEIREYLIKFLGDIATFLINRR